jgi:hypothetical protein
MLPSALGVEGYNPSVGGPSPSVSSAQSAAASVPASGAAPRATAGAAAVSQKAPEEIIAVSIGTISRYRTGGDGGNALKLLALFLKNIVENPGDDKYVQILITWLLVFRLYLISA